MTRQRARQLLAEIWGKQTVVTSAQVQEIEPHQHKHETLLDTLQRIGEDDFDWREAGAYTEKCYQHFQSLI